MKRLGYVGAVAVGAGLAAGVIAGLWPPALRIAVRLLDPGRN